MFRALPSRSALVLRNRVQQRLAQAPKRFSTTPSPLEGDAGALATRVHHGMTFSLAILTPLYFMVPDSMTDGTFNKTFGLLLSANITAHSWVGLNYVITDYVPKISKAMLGPARIVNVGLAVITMLGMSKIALSSKGGIKGVVKGVWNPKNKEPAF